MTKKVLVLFTVMILSSSVCMSDFDEEKVKNLYNWEKYEKAAQEASKGISENSLDVKDWNAVKWLAKIAVAAHSQEDFLYYSVWDLLCNGRANDVWDSEKKLEEYIRMREPDKLDRSSPRFEEAEAARLFLINEVLMETDLNDGRSSFIFSELEKLVEEKVNKLRRKKPEEPVIKVICAYFVLMNTSASVVRWREEGELGKSEKSSVLSSFESINRLIDEYALSAQNSPKLLFLSGASHLYKGLIKNCPKVHDLGISLLKRACKIHPDMKISKKASKMIEEYK